VDRAPDGTSYTFYTDPEKSGTISQKAELGQNFSEDIYTQHIYNSQRESAPTLVFIHGVGLNQQVWQPQVDHFVQHYSIVVYDMLGHGSSPRPPEDLSLAHYVGQLANLLDFLQIKKVTLIGHSMGALVAVAFSLAHPSVVEKLVPLNIVYARDADARASVVARAERVLESGQVAGIDAALARWFAGYEESAIRAKITAVRKWLNAVDPLGYGRTYYLFATSDNAFVNRLHELTMPVLYLTGEEDPNSTPAMSHQMAALTPNARALTVPNEAHMMAYICPVKVNAILNDFLRNNLNDG